MSLIPRALGVMRTLQPVFRGTHGVQSQFSRLLSTTSPTAPAAAIGGAGGRPPRAMDPHRNRQYVRISGVSSYANVDDVSLFISRNGVQLPGKAPEVLRQGTSDVFQNQAIWVYDAGSFDSAMSAASQLTGRVCGMRLVRASVADLHVVGDIIGKPVRRHRGGRNLRTFMNRLQPEPNERGRTVVITNLPFHLPPKNVWSFFSNYDVVDVRMLRRAGVATVVFRSVDEAARAIRERNNVSIQGRDPVSIKMFE